MDPFDIEEEPQEDEEPQLIPAQLDVTETQLAQQQADNRACQGQECQLCNIIDSGDEGCTMFVRRIFEMEEQFRNKVAPNILYQILAERYNTSVYRRTVEYYGPEETQRRGISQLTVAMVRRHYEQGHVRSASRTLWRLIEYEEQCVEHLKRASLWLRDANSPGALQQPNLANLNVMIKLNAEIRANIVLATRLDATSPATKVPGRS
jgi:hypothetical protein